MFAHICFLFYFFQHSAADIQQEFKKFGEIKDIHLPRDYYTKCVPDTFPFHLTAPIATILLHFSHHPSYLYFFSACRAPRGFAYVKYSAKEEAVEAVAEMNNFMMEGRVLHVTWAAGGRKSSDEMRNMMPEPRGGGRDDRPRRSRSRDRRDDRRRSRSRSRDRCALIFCSFLLRRPFYLSLICPSIITTSSSGIVAAALVRARAAGTDGHHS